MEKTQGATEESTVKTEAEIGAMRLQSKSAKDCHQPWEARRNAASRKNQPANTLIWDFRPPELFFIHQVCSLWFQQP